MTTWNFGYDIPEDQLAEIKGTGWGADDNLHNIMAAARQASAPPMWLATAPQWLTDDMPGKGASFALQSFSRGDATLDTQTLDEALFGPGSSWIIYNNLTVTGVVKWPAPVLRLLVLGTLTISGAGQLNGGAGNGDNAASNTVSGKGGDSMIGPGGAARSTTGNGNPGTRMGGGGGAVLSGVAQSSGAFGAYNRIILPYLDQGRVVSEESWPDLYFLNNTPTFIQIPARKFYSRAAWAQGGSVTGAGGGDGAGAMSLLLVAQNIVLGGDGINLSGGNGGNAFGSGVVYGGMGGPGGDLYIFSPTAAHGTRVTSVGTDGTASAGGTSPTSTHAAGDNYWFQLPSPV